MGDVSDETLMAYADGELSPTERSHVEALIASDPDLCARLAIFDATGKRLSAVFSDRLNEPLPQHLVDIVMGEGNASGVRGSVGDAPSLWGRIVGALSFEMPVWQTALASTAVLLVGVGAGAYVSRTAPPVAPPTAGPVAEQKMPLIALDNGHLVAAGPLAQILESRPGHVFHQLEDAGGNRPTATARIPVTIKSRDGYCRQFEIMGVGGVRASQIACRSENGNWRVVAHAAGGIATPINPGTKPAGEQGASLEATLERLKIGDALGPVEEAGAISRNWQR